MSAIDRISVRLSTSILNAFDEWARENKLVEKYILTATPTKEQRDKLAAAIGRVIKEEVAREKEAKK